MSNSGRWSLAALIVVIAVVVALWPRGQSTDDEPPSAGPVSSVVPDQVVPDAALDDCPTPAADATGRALSGVMVTCLRDGRPVDLGAALDGRPALLNLWAYWCAPCAHELPLLAEFARESAGTVTVLTVHSDSGSDKAVARLRDLGVTLPGVADPGAKVREAVGAPGVLPVSVLVRADGSVAKVIAKPFASLDEIRASVAENLGVPV